VFQHSQEFNRARAIDEQLRALRDAGQLLTVRTGFREITSVVIQAYKVTREAETGNTLALSLELRRIRIASSLLVQVTDPVQRRGQRTQNRGNQPTQQPPSSFAFRAAQALGAL
jgi:hypothetical protein